MARSFRDVSSAVPSAPFLWPGTAVPLPIPIARVSPSSELGACCEEIVWENAIGLPDTVSLPAALHDVSVPAPDWLVPAGNEPGTALDALSTRAPRPPWLLWRGLRLATIGELAAGGRLMTPGEDTSEEAPTPCWGTLSTVLGEPGHDAAGEEKG